MDQKTLTSDLKLILDKVLRQIDGRTLVRQALNRKIKESSTSAFRESPPLALISIGKAAVSMAMGAAEALEAQSQSSQYNLVITKHKHTNHPLRDKLANVDIIESGHPIPDENSLVAGEKLLRLCGELKKHQRGWVLCLISGGASALVECPKPGIDLKQIQQFNKKLISDNLGIEEINTARKKFSRIKQGGLARELGKLPVLALYLSDVPTNDPAVIGSGLLADENAKVEHHMLMDNLTMLKQTHCLSEELGWKAKCQGQLFEQDVNEAAEIIYRQMQAEPGVLHIWGGETSVKLPEKHGQGGRNQHLALLMAKNLAAQDRAGVFASLGTDGTDGFSDNAGAIVNEKTAGQIDNLEEEIAGANSGVALGKIKASLETGPTGSNLMDLMLGYLSP